MRFRLLAFVVAIAATLLALSPGYARDGEAHTLSSTQVWTVPAQLDGRAYEIMVSLPESYATDLDRRYPVLYVTDADYGFPIIRAIAGRLTIGEPRVEDFILVGLSYANGEDVAKSRRRDYTPVKRRDGEGGGGPAYQAYLRDYVIPFVEAKFRADPARRLYAGHSYGGLLGAQILLTEPQLFHAYLLGSPSLWYRGFALRHVTDRFTETNRDLKANVFLYVGEYEAMRPGDRRFNDRRDMVQDTVDFAHRLASQRYRNLKIKLDVIPGEDHVTVVPSGYTRGLLQLLPTRP